MYLVNCCIDALSIGDFVKVSFIVYSGKIRGYFSQIIVLVASQFKFIDVV